MKIMYIRAEDNGISIVIGASKESIERTLGRHLSDAEYKEIVWGTVPKSAILPREIQDSDIPYTREFRDAWYDDTEGNKIGIELNKAKGIQLERLRTKRDELLLKYDKLLMRAQEIGTEQEVNTIKVKKEQLREATDALKALTPPKSIEEIKAATPDLSDY